MDASKRLKKFVQFLFWSGPELNERKEKNIIGKHLQNETRGKLGIKAIKRSKSGILS